MSLKDILKQFSGGDHATIERLTSKVETLRRELNEAEAQARKAYLKNSKRGGSALPADRAEKTVADVRKRLDRTQGALREAQERKVGAEAAQAQDAERKRQRAARASIIRLHEAGVVVDQKIDELVEALHAALDEARALNAIANDPDIVAQTSRAFGALTYCVSTRLLFLQGKTDSTATPARTKFVTYLPPVPSVTARPSPAGEVESAA